MKRWFAVLDVGSIPTVSKNYGDDVAFDEAERSIVENRQC